MESVQARKSTFRLSLLHLLSDLRWHGYWELREVAGVRYGARLRELIRLGYLIRKQPAADGRFYQLASMERGRPVAKKVKIYMTESDARMLLVEQATASGLAAIREALATFLEHKENL